ncbi:MAG: helix-turn-helix domain-containing protein [Bdellovibrionales bacterium]
MRMISIEQIRAARGLLNWRQKDLAEAAGISTRSLVLIEQGSVKPRVETLAYIQTALEKKHILSTENNGVQLFAERFEVERLEGPSCIEKLFNDTTNTLAGEGGEYLLSGTDERLFLANVSKKSLHAYYDVMRTLNASERILSRQGDTHFIGLPASYRWITPELFGMVPYSLYGNRLAIIAWGPPVRMVFIRNKSVADSFRAQFEANWMQAQIPPFARLAMQRPALNRPRHELSENELRQLEEAE